MEFIHLHVKSVYSLLSSACKLEDLVRQAAESGFSSLALTDENVMYGAAPFYKLCRKYGIKPIIGLTLSVKSEMEPDKSRPLVLLAENDTGYRSLLKLSTLAQTAAKPSVSLKQLSGAANGLIAVTPGPAGEIEQLILQGDKTGSRAALRTYIDIFGQSNIYLSLQRHGRDGEERLDSALLELCELEGVEPVASNDVKFLNKEDAPVYQCLKAIKDGRKLAGSGEPAKGEREHYLKAAADMSALFYDIPAALANTAAIAKRCNVEIEFNRRVLPKYPVPHNRDPHEYLCSLCETGVKSRYAELTPEIRERLDFELSVIEKMSFSDYFLIVWDFMKYAHERGILTGPGRGSAAGSLVAYALFITNVDPIEHGLLFERFLNPERISMPDIDIDFPDNRRDEMIAYVHRKYGSEHVAQIVTFGTLAARASIRDVGRVMDIDIEEVDALTKLISGRPGTTLKSAYRDSPELQKRLKQSEKLQTMYKLAVKIEGMPRHTSTHAAGVVISDRPLTDVTALQEGHEDILLTQYPMDVLEEIGLLKMDFLGLRNLTLIDNILRQIKRSGQRTVNLNTMPLDDGKTFAMLSRGDTTGVFQLESSGMRSVLQRLKPTHFEDIVAVNALYRPGPMENIPVYINRKHGKETITYPHLDLKPILEKTYGVIVYQEQIMQIASVMAGFSLGEADLLRRAVSKKKRDILNREREHFIQGSVNKGYGKDAAGAIYELIVRFADYGFNRSHAVAYSVIAYQLAYLKANYPVYFIAALLSSVVSNESKIFQYIGEARHKGIEILPPSINKSGIPFLVENQSVRYSLLAVKSVGAAAVREIIEKRNQKPFQDLFDFCVRVSLNRRVIESLIHAGCLDEFGHDRAVLLASLDSAMEYAELAGGEDDQIALFLSEDIIPKPQYVDVPDQPQNQRLAFEKEALGFYLSEHPAEQFRSRLEDRGALTVMQILQGEERRHVKTGGYITAVRTIKTKKGDQMAFLTLTDKTGELEVVAFPNVYGPHVWMLKKEQLLYMEGKTEKRGDRLQFIMQKASLLEELPEAPQAAKAVRKNTLFLKVDREAAADGRLHDVKEILKEYPGQTEVVVYYEEEKKTMKLSDEWKVVPSDACLDRLRRLLGSDNAVLRE
ncbi:DNA polymerase III subunit alpha [Bacillus marinisedimentorum]|uniref:DNA polymerase III subunit alpha n=1 Tax=Bacillus marinisedimentorum TaxID=1821260 RepID=UPI0008724159|nr:DNA polymerase III subunit alpha [Bacillus marinisedimentorum]